MRKEAVRKLVHTEADVLQSGLQPDKPGIAALCWWPADGGGKGTPERFCPARGAGARIGTSQLFNFD